jgi:hypothetical protein
MRLWGYREARNSTELEGDFNPILPFHFFDWSINLFKSWRILIAGYQLICFFKQSKARRSCFTSSSATASK